MSNRERCWRRWASRISHQVVFVRVPRRSEQGGWSIPHQYLSTRRHASRPSHTALLQPAERRFSQIERVEEGRTRIRVGVFRFVFEGEQSRTGLVAACRWHPHFRRIILPTGQINTRPIATVGEQSANSIGMIITSGLPGLGIDVSQSSRDSRPWPRQLSKGRGGA